MAHWNKVSSSSPYPDDVRSGVSEGPVRAWFVRSIGSLQILAVGLFIFGSLKLDANILEERTRVKHLLN